MDVAYFTLFLSILILSFIFLNLISSPFSGCVDEALGDSAAAEGQELKACALQVRAAQF